MNILITGASGLVGSALTPFLITRGHSVVSLVRRAPVPGKKEVRWDPASGYIDSDGLKGGDAVVHLAGENIAQGRWTKKKKRRIIESRVKGTALIASTIAELEPLPRVLISASAIGYYGNRGDRTLIEEDAPGNDFISKVCREWEKAAEPATKKGVRVVFMRMGIVLSSAGGALARLLLPFKMGLGGKIGTGNQFMSWTGIDDVIGAFYHTLLDSRLDGPVNLVSPNPVTNLEFTKTLGKALSRPTILSVPAVAVSLAFGEMGKELLLSSTRVEPKKLVEAGYKFCHQDLEGALLHLLGRQ